MKKPIDPEFLAALGSDLRGVETPEVYMLELILEDLTDINESKGTVPGSYADIGARLGIRRETVGALISKKYGSKSLQAECARRSAERKAGNVPMRSERRRLSADPVPQESANPNENGTVDPAAPGSTLSSSSYSPNTRSQKRMGFTPEQIEEDWSTALNATEEEIARAELYAEHAEVIKKLRAGTDIGKVDLNILHAAAVRIRNPRPRMVMVDEVLVTEAEAKLIAERDRQAEKERDARLNAERAAYDAAFGQPEVVDPDPFGASGVARS